MKNKSKPKQTNKKQKQTNQVFSNQATGCRFTNMCLIRTVERDHCHTFVLYSNQIRQ